MIVRDRGALRNMVLLRLLLRCGRRSMEHMMIAADGTLRAEAGGQHQECCQG